MLPSGLFGLTTTARSAPRSASMSAISVARCPTQCGGAGVFCIGRPKDCGTSWRHQSGDVRQQYLRSRRRDDMGRGRRTVGPCRDLREPFERGPVRQPGEQIGGQFRQRIGIRIDPGRQVDERFRSAREQAPRGAEIAAVNERFGRAQALGELGHYVRRAHATRHADRTRRWLSGSAGACNRPSGDLDGSPDRRARSRPQSRDAAAAHPAARWASL